MSAQMFNRFARDQTGNITVLSAIMVVPMLLLVAGVIDTSRHNRMKNTMQTSADAAVIAAFYGPSRSWRKRQKTAHLQFKLNMQKGRLSHGVQTKMTRQTQKNRIVFTYKAKTRLDSMFGSLSPFSGDTLTVQSRAAWEIGSRKHPHLIGNGDSGATQDTTG